MQNGKPVEGATLLPVFILHSAFSILHSAFRRGLLDDLDGLDDDLVHRHAFHAAAQDGLGLAGLFAFLWSLKSNQYDDMDGSALRPLSDDDL